MACGEHRANEAQERESDNVKDKTDILFLPRSLYKICFSVVVFVCLCCVSVCVCVCVCVLCVLACAHMYMLV